MELGPMVEGVFQQRLNRFAAMVANWTGGPRWCTSPTRGACASCCGRAPAASSRLGRPRAARPRSTSRWSRVASDRAVGEPREEYGGAAPGRVLVSADARLPPGASCWEAFHEGQAASHSPSSTQARREVVYGDSRLDLLLSGPRGACFIEVKSVTLVEDGVALFPDAPTERGRRHLGELVRAVEEGCRAAAVFVIQREDARACAPHDDADPAFGLALRDAVAAGVEVYAYVCRVTRRKIRLAHAVPVLL